MSTSLATTSLGMSNLLLDTYVAGYVLCPSPPFVRCLRSVQKSHFMNTTGMIGILGSCSATAYLASNSPASVPGTRNAVLVPYFELTLQTSLSFFFSLD